MSCPATWGFPQTSRISCTAASSTFSTRSVLGLSFEVIGTTIRFSFMVSLAELYRPYSHLNGSLLLMSMKHNYNLYFQTTKDKILKYRVKPKQANVIPTPLPNQSEQMVVTAISQHLGRVTSWSSLQSQSWFSLSSVTFFLSVCSSLLLVSFYQHSMSFDSSCGVHSLRLLEFFPRVNSSSGGLQNTSPVVVNGERPLPGAITELCECFWDWHPRMFWMAYEERR